MSWYHRLPIIGELLDFGEDVAYEVKRARLEKLDRDEPIELTDAVLGTFRLRRELTWFETRRQWAGSEVNLTLDGEWGSLEEVSEDTAAELAVAARTFWDDEARWLRTCEELILRDLYELARSWAEDREELLTQEQFLERIKPQSIGVSLEGRFDVWFEDGDVFAGHGILVYGTLEGGPEVAEMHG